MLLLLIGVSTIVKNLLLFNCVSFYYFCKCHRSLNKVCSCFPFPFPFHLYVVLPTNAWIIHRHVNWGFLTLSMPISSDGKEGWSKDVFQLVLSLHLSRSKPASNRALKSLAPLCGYIVYCRYSTSFLLPIFQIFDTMTYFSMKPRVTSWSFLPGVKKKTISPYSCMKSCLLYSKAQGHVPPCRFSAEIRTSTCRNRSLTLSLTHFLIFLPSHFLSPFPSLLKPGIWRGEKNYFHRSPQRGRFST